MYSNIQITETTKSVTKNVLSPLAALRSIFSTGYLTTNFSEATTNDAEIVFSTNAKRYLSKMFYPIVAVAAVALMMFLANNKANANDVIELSMPACSHSADGCNNWERWVTHTRQMKYQSDKHNVWPFGPQWFHCNTTVTYRVRQCKTNPFMNQIDIVNIELDLAYKIWVMWHGWIYPCREALEILKGSDTEVSSFLSALYTAIYEDIVEADYQMVFDTLEALDEQFGGNYVHFRHHPCELPDPGNPWADSLLTVVTVNSTCQAMCVTWSYDNDPIIYIDANQTNLDNPTHSTEIPKGVPIQFLADRYNDGNIQGLVVETLNDADLEELNDYIQTEINPYIPEVEHKVPPLYGSPRMRITKLPCADDFCCVYKMNVCQDSNNKVRLFNKEVVGNVPQECINSQPIPLAASCPPSIVTPTPYPCVSSCSPTVPQAPTSGVAGESMPINIYPNPTTKVINFEIPNGQVLSNLELFNTSGDLLGIFNTNIASLDLSTYNSGEYYLCFTLNNVKYYRSIILTK